MAVEPEETLNQIKMHMRLVIGVISQIGPFGEAIDRVCYHLDNDYSDDNSHSDADEVFDALTAAGVQIENAALDDYPHEIWERRWPNTNWLDYELPRIFHVLNRFGHDVNWVSYEPKGAAAGLYLAAKQHAWHASDTRFRPDSFAPDDLTAKSAWPVFSHNLNKAVFLAIHARQFSPTEAVVRLDAISDEIVARWPNKILEATAPGVFPYGAEHEALLDWAISSVFNTANG